jgi:hypothetical protein
MNTREGIMRLFAQGKPPKEIMEIYSRKSYYRYLKLHIILKIKAQLQWLADTKGWDSCNLPELKRVEKEVRKW